LPMALPLVIALVGCQSASGRSAPIAQPPTFSSTDLLDDATAPLEAAPGSRYPGLYAPGAFAVLMPRDMVLRRFEAEADMASLPLPRRNEERTALERLAQQFYLCELHLTSNFGDASVARDAVTLRGMRIILADDTGRNISAAAKHLDYSMPQDPDGALFMATTLVLFPKSDAADAPELIGPATQRMTLSIIGLDSRFDASWLLVPPVGR